MSDPLLYFAYGSNLHPLRLQRRTPSARLAGLAVLEGHVLRGARYHGLPAAYLRRIESVAAIPDPDPERGPRELALALDLETFRS